MMLVRGYEGRKVQEVKKVIQKELINKVQALYGVVLESLCM